MEHAQIVDTFMNEAGKYAPLTPADEFETLKAYKETGDNVYKEKLILHNLRFIMAVASKYKKLGTSPLEMINVGTIGFAHAIEKYDMESGSKLITFGVWWVKAHITGYLRDLSNTIRLPANRYIELQKGITESKKHNTPLEGKVHEYFNLTQEGSSFSDPVGGGCDDTLTIGDTISDNDPTPYDNTETSSMHDSIMKAITNLGGKDKEVLDGLFGLTGDIKTLAQVGDSIGISYERVRQIKNDAIAKLKSRNPELAIFTQA